MLQPPESDPFLEHMFARMSPGARFLFTPAQIDEIKKAFSARSRGVHGLDVRRSVGLFGKSYYFVLLAGRERRRSAQAASRVTNLSYRFAAAGIFLAVCLLLAAAR